MDHITQFLSSLLSSDPAAGIGIGSAFIAIGVAYLGGILSSLTPCVYPMIPITVSVVGGMGPHRKSWQEIWIRGLAYVSGMTVVYSFLGVLAGLTGKVFGSFTNTSGWYLTLGLIMTLAALLMMDVIPFDPMMWWEQAKRKLGKKSKPTQQKEMTLVGAFVLGASSGFIAAPCTTPVLTAILAYIAKTQSIGLGMSLMVAFSLGLGTLLLIIAAFAGALQILPRSGQWMKLIKVASGVILLVFGEYLIFRAGQMGGS